MDEPDDSTEMHRIKSRIERLSFDPKMIFISKPNGHEECINSNSTEDDFIREDEIFIDKLKIAVQEFSFTKKYREDYDTDTITVNHFFGTRSQYFIPFLIVFALLLVALIIYLA